MTRQRSGAQIEQTHRYARMRTDNPSADRRTDGTDEQTGTDSRGGPVSGPAHGTQKVPDGRTDRHTDTQGRGQRNDKHSGDWATRPTPTCRGTPSCTSDTRTPRPKIGGLGA